jgi:hypothetical protein
MCAVVMTCALFTACSSVGQPVGSVTLPARGPVSLRPSATFDAAAIDESSGIVASRRHGGLYWTHNDSGGAPVIYAVDREGKLVGEPVRVLGASNVDWEDIAADGDGNLWIADIGNNLNARTDLCLYVLPEPDPRVVKEARVSRRIDVRYPDQRLFPPPVAEFDAEALFVANGRPYILSKHRGSGTTKLYRLDRQSDGLSAPMTLLGTFDIEGMVTAADVSPDGRSLLVLTYTGIWLFEAASGDEYLGGSVRWLPIRAGQCEGICFDLDGSIVVTNEQRSIFGLSVEDLAVVR